MPLHRHLLAAAVLLTLAAVEPASVQASQGREDMPLEVVLEASSAVVLAVPATPSQRVDAIDITPNGKHPDPEKYPPYKRHRQRWLVQEVLLGAPALVGQVLELDAAEWQMHLDVHRRYYVEGVNKIPIYREYSPSYPYDRPPKEPARIVMLMGGPGTWQFTADNSVESVRERPRVEAALRKIKARRSPQ